MANLFKKSFSAGKAYVGSVSGDANQIKSTLGNKFGTWDNAKAFANTFDQRIVDGLTDLLTGATGIRTSNIPEISDTVLKVKQENRVKRQDVLAGAMVRSGDDPPIGKQLKYPKSFAREDGESDQLTNFIHFRSLQRLNPDGKEQHYDIFLYVPNTLSDSINVVYTEAEKDLTAEGMAAIFPLESAKWFSGTDTSLDEFFTIMKSGAPAGDFIKKTTGRTINPLKFQLFQGVNTRTYTYNFEFQADTLDESAEIQEIIYAFRKSMLPGTAGPTSRTYTFPHEWEIRYHGPISKWIDRPMKTACTSATVNWAPNGFKHHIDGSPTAITLALTFTELLTLDRKRYDNLSSAYFKSPRASVARGEDAAPDAESNGDYESGPGLGGGTQMSGESKGLEVHVSQFAHEVAGVQ